MNSDPRRRRKWVAWLLPGTLLAVSLVLGFVQYRWIGDVSRAETERLRATVQISLNRLSQDFNAEIVSAASALIPDRSAAAMADRRSEYEQRYAQWRGAARHHGIFRSIHIAVPQSNRVTLYRLDLTTGQFVPAEWPDSWSRLRVRLDAVASGDRAAPPGPYAEDFPLLLEVPYFGRSRPRARTREGEWLLLEIDPVYLGKSVIPQLLARHLGASGTIEYEARIVAAERPEFVIYDAAGDRTATADGTVRLFDPRVDLILRRAGLWRTRENLTAEDGPAANRGRWIMSVWNRAGSVDAVVAQSRNRNLVVAAALLCMIVLASVALLRYTRREQKLADLQMEFVAGVSHELRTPLTVMRTAGHNLQGRVSNDPARVQQYGVLIEDESNKLTAIVEKVLRFANANQGRVITERDLVDIGAVIDEALHADNAMLEQSRVTVEKTIADDLPPVLGDRTTLRHAFGNLINNAARYGSDGELIRICATRAGREVEVTIEDRGQGIPRSEIEQVFDPFFRGRRAVEDQIHGTGLGLSLTKRIVEAHDGSIAVASDPGKGTQFTVRLPAAPGQEHEFTNSAD